MPSQGWTAATADELTIARVTGAKRVSECQWSGGHCINPEHVDRHASFGFTRGDKFAIVANCLGCHDDQAIKKAIAALGIDLASVGHPARTRRRRALEKAEPFELPPPLENENLPLMWHDHLTNGGYPDQLDYLVTQRGFTMVSIEQRRIGFDGQRFTFPVHYAGHWRNVRRYLPGAPQKWIQMKGHGTALLYPTQVLAENRLPVLLVEGEADAVLAGQIGEGKFVALTGTGGAGTPPKDLSPLASREVFVSYDLDKAGHDGAEKMLAKLHAAGITAYTLDLRKLGVPE